MRCKIDAFTMGMNDRLGDRQPEPSALEFRRLERAESPPVL